jgi:hypothetical protein
MNSIHETDTMDSEVRVMNAASTTEINMAWCNEDIPNEDDHEHTLRLQNEGKCLKMFHEGAIGCSIK